MIFLLRSRSAQSGDIFRKNHQLNIQFVFSAGNFYYGANEGSPRDGYILEEGEGRHAGNMGGEGRRGGGDHLEANFLIRFGFAVPSLRAIPQCFPWAAPWWTVFGAWAGSAWPGSPARTSIHPQRLVITTRDPAWRGVAWRSGGRRDGEGEVGGQNYAAALFDLLRSVRVVAPIVPITQLLASIVPAHKV